MQDRNTSGSAWFSTRVTIITVIALAVAVFVLTWVGISRSRDDSYRLLVEQGTAFTEALAQACQSAITAGSYYDRLIEERYFDLASTLADLPPDEIDGAYLARYAAVHDLNAVWVYGMDTSLLASSLVDPTLLPPDWVTTEVGQLIANPESPYVLLVDADPLTEETTHYYISLTNRLESAFVLSIPAPTHAQATRRTGIGYLAQNMARERGVEYIIYQAPDGIVFSSRNTGPLLAIESDTFLSEALAGDSIATRRFEFQGDEVLEIVRPFSSEEYPTGLFRIGLSLSGYYNIARGFDRQMVILALILFSLLVVVILYLNSRRHRRELSVRYSQMKSLTAEMLDKMRTGVAVVDHTGVIRMANEAFTTVFDHPEPVGLLWNEVVTVPRLSFDTFASEAETTSELEVDLGSGDDARVLLVGRSRIVPDRAGEGWAMVAVVYDITRLKRFERQSARRLRLSELGNLAAGVAHEIRNPLNTISIASQRLAAEFTPVDNADEYTAFTRTIKTETKRLDDIITRFLALTREEQRSRQKIAMPELLAEIARLSAAEMESLGIGVEIDCPETATVMADPDRLKQIFVNLLNNAKEALGGSPGRIRIAVQSESDHTSIMVEDSGPGIAEAEREKVLTPYYTTKEAGTGLGLPTVFKIVTEELGGDLTVATGSLGGAALRISIPHEA